MHVQLHLHRNEMQILRSTAAAENCHACDMGFPKGPASKGPGSFWVLDIHK